MQRRVGTRAIRLRAAGVVAAALGAVVVSGGSARAIPIPGEWVVQYDGPHVTIDTVTEGALPGRDGTHHTGLIDLDGSDDWFIAVLADWDCPPGATPPVRFDYETDYDCERLTTVTLEDYNGDFVEAWLREDLRRLRFTGAAPLEGTQLDPDPELFDLDVRVRAAGDRVVELVERWQARNPDDRHDVFRLKDVWSSRDHTTARGHVGWLPLTGPHTTTTSTKVLNLRHSWKGFGDGQ